MLGRIGTTLVQWCERDMTTPLAWVLAGMQDSNPDVASRTRSRTHIARIVTRILLKTNL